AILLQNNEFPVDYEKPNENCDLVYVKSQKEFFLKKAELYLKLHSEKTDFKKDFVVVNASEKAIHYYLKINGTDEYDQQQMFRQHYQTLANWRLKDILLMLKLNPKKDLEIITDPEKKFSAVPCGDLDFNSLYPSLMMQNNICFLTKIEEVEEGDEYYEISLKDVKGRVKYVRFSKKKKGLIPTILELLVKNRKQAKKDRSKYDKSNVEYVNSLIEEFKNQGDIESLALSKTSAFIKKYYNYYNILQDALKKLANSIYEQFGNQRSIICDYDISSSITGFGQMYITMASNYMQNVEISESVKEKKFIWKYTDTDSIFFCLSHIIINEIIKKYENCLLDKNITEEDFIKTIYDIQEEMVIRTYDESIKLQDEINEWMAIEIKSPRIVMEYEKSMIPNLFISKKKYNGLTYEYRKYYYDGKWKDIKKHIEDELNVDNVTQEMEDDYIETTNEYILLSKCRKFDNLLAKGTDLIKRNSTLICRVILKKLLYTIFDYKEYAKYLYKLKFTTIEEYQSFINGTHEQDFCRDTSMIVVEDFVKYLYSKESELDLKFFEQNAKNNDDEDEGEMTFIELTDHRCFKYNSKGSWKVQNGKIVLYDEDGNLIDFSRNRKNQKNWEKSDRDYIFKRGDEIKEIDGKIVIIKYNEAELKQVSDERIYYIKKFVNDMKLIGVEVPKPRFVYVVIKKHSVKKVWKRMVLVDKFNPLIYRIDKYHYLKGIVPFLAICLGWSEDKTEKYLISITDKYTNESLEDYYEKEENVSKEEKID
ncbi:16106_t:CDS:2, partial [Cetraspora pellucida]